MEEGTDSVHDNVYTCKADNFTDKHTDHLTACKAVDRRRWRKYERVRNCAKEIVRKKKGQNVVMMDQTGMKQEESKNVLHETYQMYCSRMEEELKAAEGDINKCLEIAFQLWAASYRITSDLSMQMEHIGEFARVYGGIMPAQNRLYVKEMQRKVSEAYEYAQRVSDWQEREMTGMMQKVFSTDQAGKEFFGGEEAYESMSILWDSGELIEKLKEFIFIDENAGRDGVEYILQGIG